MIFAIGIIFLIADAMLMAKEYKRDNLTGVVFWGILLLSIIIRLN